MKHEAWPIKRHLRKLEDNTKSLRARKERLEKKKRARQESKKNTGVVFF
jgi:hypothetical protein